MLFFLAEYGWWFSKKDSDLSFHARESSDIDDGHTESLQLIRKTFEEQVSSKHVLLFSRLWGMSKYFTTNIRQV